jgi:hypothetical protein
MTPEAWPMSPYRALWAWLRSKWRHRKFDPGWTPLDD